jgi:hypothetical protein
MEFVFCFLFFVLFNPIPIYPLPKKLSYRLADWPTNGQINSSFEVVDFEILRISNLKELCRIQYQKWH